MSRQRDHIIECFQTWWKIANKSLRLFVENLEKDRCVGSIFGNQFHFLLMQIVFSSMYLCINVSMYLYSYPSTQDIFGLAAGGSCEHFEVRLKMTIECLRDTLRGRNRASL